MITQAEFDTVLFGIREQGGPSMRSGLIGACAYRGENGRKCAVGWLIPDEDYRPSFERFGVAALIERGFLAYDKATVCQLLELQGIHDGASEAEAFFPEWEYRMSAFARDHNLTYTAPANV